MVFSKVSVLIPTRGRVARLRTLLYSYQWTTSHSPTSELIFRVDDDDFDTQAFLSQYSGFLHVIVGPRFSGYQSLPTFFNEMLAHASGDVLMCGNDDMVFKTADWPSRLLDIANQYPDGLFDLGVTTHNETHYPFSTVSRWAADRMGFLWDPRIFWGDIFLRDVMAAFTRNVMVPSVEIDHDWAGYAPDEVFRQSDKDITSKDPTYWTGTHARAVSEAIQKLREQCV